MQEQFMNYVQNISPKLINAIDHVFETALIHSVLPIYQGVQGDYAINRKGRCYFIPAVVTLIFLGFPLT